MRKRIVLRAVCLLFAAISAASFAPPVEAQIDFKLKTVDGGSTLTERYYYNRGDTVLCPRGIFNGCAVSLNSIQIYNWTGEFSGYANVNSGPQTFSISGNLAHNGVDNQNQYGEAKANHVSSLYADVLPGMSVKVKFRHSSSITWNIPVNGGYGQATWAFTPYPLTTVGGGVTVNTAVPSDTRLEPATVSAITAMARASYPIIVDGGKTYYFLGTFDTSGYIWTEKQAPAGETGSFSSSVNDIQVRHIGKALYYNGGAGQTGRTGETLPLPASVKVVDEVTNAPVTGVSIQFIVYAPDGTLVSARVTQTLSDGVASFSVPLGALPGDYSIVANCGNQCVDGGQTVSMTAKARGKALVCVDCNHTGRVSRELENPFRLKVVDMFDDTAVASAAVRYNTLRFTDLNGNTGSDVHGAGMARLVEGGITNPDGISRAYLRLGTSSGTYTVRAYCASCLEGPEQFPTGTALGRTIIIETNEETAGDPTQNCGPCPSGCCPCTPVMRTRANPPSGGATFTSAEDERRIGLGAQLLPACLNMTANITWTVADEPADNINSGTPAQPSPGFSSSFEVGSGDFPRPPQGRALPLAYKITATQNYNGTPITAVTRVKQDEIDKCRQEYVDYGIPLTEVPRSTFTLGLDGLGRPYDCYAHIFPRTRYEEVVRLRRIFTIRVNSGYRSPRANKFVAGSISLRSWHLFGRAIDIEVLPETPLNYYSLWSNTNNPKLLENSSGYLVKRDSSGNLVIGDDTGGYPVPLVFYDVSPSGWMHLGE